MEVANITQTKQSQHPKKLIEVGLCPLNGFNDQVGSEDYNFYTRQGLGGKENTKKKFYRPHGFIIPWFPVGCDTVL